MNTVNPTDAKMHLSELVAKAASAETQGSSNRLPCVEHSGLANFGETA
jgi:hypothetical protein